MNSNSNSASQAAYLVLPQQRRGEPELEEGVGALALAPHERRGLPVHLFLCFMVWGKWKGTGLHHTSVSYTNTVGSPSIGRECTYRGEVGLEDGDVAGDVVKHGLLRRPRHLDGAARLCCVCCGFGL